MLDLLIIFYYTTTINAIILVFWGKKERTCFSSLQMNVLSVHIQLRLMLRGRSHGTWELLSFLHLKEYYVHIYIFIILPEAWRFYHKQMVFIWPL